MEAQAEAVERNRNEAKKQWVSSKEKNRAGCPVELDKMKRLRGSKRAWDAGDLQKDEVPSSEGRRNHRGTGRNA